jgi:hypothetical protein
LLENGYITNVITTGHWWLTFVILATWEAEIERTAFQDQPRAKSLQDTISTEKNGHDSMCLSFHLLQES